MASIVISEFMDAAAVARLSSVHDTLYDPNLVDNGDALSAALAGARAFVVRNRTQVTAALLDRAGPSLTCVGRLGVGLDNIDLDACAARGVVVYPATGANDDAVAEYAVTAAATLLRGAFFAGDAMRAGAWPRQALMGREIAGKTFGAVGFGRIARATVRRAAALGMRCVAFDPHLPHNDPAWSEAASVSLDDLFGTADVVSLHMPLTTQTRRMIDAQALGRMKPDAILINAARGGVLDEAALVDALRGGRLGGAAIDVFETEPLDAAAAARFQDCPHLILTPHIAGVTRESNIRVSNLIAEHVLENLR